MAKTPFPFPPCRRTSSSLTADAAGINYRQKPCFIDVCVKWLLSSDVSRELAHRAQNRRFTAQVDDQRQKLVIGSDAIITR